MKRELIPIWQGDTVYDESVLMIEDFFGEIRPFRLAYPIGRVLSVKSADGGKIYKAGKDYEVNGYGELVVKRGDIPFLPWKEYRLPVFDRAEEGKSEIAAADGLGAWRMGDLFSDGEGMRAYAISVTYTHRETSRYDIVPAKGHLLPRFQRRRKGAFTLVAYGDSITYGWAASGMKDIRKPPFCKPYAEIFAEETGATFFNCSVSGKCADWAAEDENVAAVIGKQPDLVLLAFGMNDAGVFRPEQYAENIRTIIGKIRSVRRETEFLLVSPILPNPLVGFSAGSSIKNYHEEYPAANDVLEREFSGVAHANVTAVHHALLERKSLRDTLSNNVNHPNDFMHRVYAQVLLKTVE